MQNKGMKNLNGQNNTVIDSSAVRRVSCFERKSPPFFSSMLLIAFRLDAIDTLN